MKMKKTTINQFNDFKRGFTELQERLGLTQYEVFFVLGDMKDKANDGEIIITEMGKSATVFLADTTSGKTAELFDPLAIGAHECIHLLLHRLKWLGETRYIENNDLDEEEEALVRRLEKVL